MIRNFCAIVAAALILPSSAQAAVTYKFVTEQGGYAAGGFSFTVPNFIENEKASPFVAVRAPYPFIYGYEVKESDLSDCTITLVGENKSCISQWLMHDNRYFTNSDTPYDTIAFRGGTPSSYTSVAFYFESGSFTKTGIFKSQLTGNQGYLIVSSDSAVPEPSTWAMMLIGFGMVGAVARRKLRRDHSIACG